MVLLTKSYLPVPDIGTIKIKGCLMCLSEYDALNGTKSCLKFNVNAFLKKGNR